MVIDDPDLASVTVVEAEDDPILVVHPNTEEAREISLQRLEAVSRRIGQVPGFPRLVEPIELSPSQGPEFLWQAPAGDLASHSVEDVLGSLVGEVEEHVALIPS